MRSLSTITKLLISVLSRYIIADHISAVGKLSSISHLRRSGFFPFLLADQPIAAHLTDTSARTQVAELAANTKDAQARAEASFKKKEIQLQEGAKAMAEYLAAGRAEREKTARLRLLREAKEAADAEAAARGEVVAQAQTKPTAAKKRAR
jgi:hypothetical protein